MVFKSNFEPLLDQLDILFGSRYTALRLFWKERRDLRHRHLAQH
jgi:hypothetical protein